MADVFIEISSMEKTGIYGIAGLMLISLFNCKEPANQTLVSKPKPLVVEKFNLEQHLVDYEALKERIPRYKKAQEGKSKEEVKDFMFHLVVDSIWPYWYGTEWDFNGITETPRKGLIACGYFVSTTLRDGGVKLNRYKIAQQAASVIVDRLCNAGTKRTYTDMEHLENYLQERGDGNIYVLGLSNHVGFVIRDKGQNYFVHADYTRDGLAKRESLRESVPIKNSNILVIGSVLDNTELVDNWLSN